MTGKLTLSVDREVIRKAKRLAKKRGMSVSRMVQTYLEVVSRAPDSETDPPILRRLRGSLRGASVDDYRRHLREKYQ